MANQSDNPTRRDFIKKSAVVSLAALTADARGVFAAGDETLRIGLIGCGGRGTVDTLQALTCTDKPVKLWAMGDLFDHKLKESYKNFLKHSYGSWKFPALGDRLDVSPDRKFTGFDAFQKVIDSGVDMVILATPPGFRPEHFGAAVKADKHVFMQKPVAVDPVGVRSIITTAERAKKKNLTVMAGTQRRHQSHYLDIMKRIHGGDIGKVVSGQCYWISGAMLHRGMDKQPQWSDMEYQCREWYFHTWLCGDHIVEQHVHNLDVLNWAIGTHPIKAMGVGGRQVRTGPNYGNMFDHFAIEYEYPDGVRTLSMCRQTDGTSGRVSENIMGTNGRVYTDPSIGYIKGANAYKYDGPQIDPYVQQQIYMQDSIRRGDALNEGRQVAESTLTAIMGRMSAYTGREISWDWVMKASKLDLRPPKYEFGPLPMRPVAIPGQTKLI